jgi:hypothetical protein
MNEPILSANPNMKNQHYVWGHYLNAWAAVGTFCCYRHKDRQFLATQPKSVASETYFYEAHQLTAGDLAFLESFISQATDKDLQEVDRDYVKLSQQSFKLRERLKTRPYLNPYALPSNGSYAGPSGTLANAFIPALRTNPRTSLIGCATKMTISTARNSGAMTSITSYRCNISARAGCAKGSVASEHG